MSNKRLHSLSLGANLTFRGLPRVDSFPALSKRWTRHDGWFVVFSILLLVLFRSSLGALISLALRDDRYSHVLLIPVISAFLVYVQRRRIFTDLRYCPSLGVPVLVAGLALLGLAQTGLATLNPNDRLSVVMLAAVLIGIAGFILCYGAQSFRAALFPLFFLLLMIPIPTFALDKIVLALQKWSTVTSYVLFKMLGVPVFWQQFKLSLPGVVIEIAEECSGIRSSLALLITSILAGRLFLQSNSRRVLFSLLTVPIVIFKNALRIVTISCLGVYVSPDFLYGRLHRYGGLPFSLVSLAILVPSLLLLQKGEAPPSEVLSPHPEVV